MNQTKKKTGRVADRGRYPLARDDLLTSIMFWRWLYIAVDDAVERWLARPRIGDTRPAAGPVTFKPRHHFKADGTPKQKMTLVAAQRWVQRHPEARFYRCSVCGSHHVGHKVVTKTVRPKTRRTVTA